MKAEEECLWAVGHALVGCQFIEEGIRLYLERALLLVEKRMGKDIRVRLSVDDFQAKPLSIVLREFAKFNGNDGLIKDIEHIIPKRNDLAHKAFFRIYSHSEDGKDLSELVAEARAIKQHAEKCIEQLHVEIEYIEKLCDKEGLIAHPAATNPNPA